MPPIVEILKRIDALCAAHGLSLQEVADRVADYAAFVAAEELGLVNLAALRKRPSLQGRRPLLTLIQGGKTSLASV